MNRLVTSFSTCDGATDSTSFLGHTGSACWGESGMTGQIKRPTMTQLLQLRWTDFLFYWVQLMFKKQKNKKTTQNVNKFTIFIAAVWFRLLNALSLFLLHFLLLAVGIHHSLGFTWRGEKCTSET